MLLDDAQVVVEIKHGQDVDGDLPAGGHEDGVHLPVGVVQRQERGPDVLGGLADGVGRVPRGNVLRDVGDEVMVGDADALGQAGGAGAVVDGGERGAGLVRGQVRPGPGGGLGGGREEVGPVVEAVRGLDGAGDVVAEVVDAVLGKVGLRGGGEDVVDLGGVGEDELDLGIVDLVCDFWGLLVNGSCILQHGNLYSGPFSLNCIVVRTLGSVGRVSTGKGTGAAHDAEIERGHQDVVGRAHHDNVALLEAEPLDAHADAAHPPESLACGNALGGVLVVDPYRPVGDAPGVGEEVVDNVDGGDVNVGVYRLDRHGGGDFSFPVSVTTKKK